MVIACWIRPLLHANGSIGDFLQDPDRNNDGDGQTPKVCIYWMLLDEQFKYVDGNFSRVGSTAVVKEHNEAALRNIPVLPE
jgi:hypothetical protein